MLHRTFRRGAGGSTEILVFTRQVATRRFLFLHLRLPSCYSDLTLHNVLLNQNVFCTDENANG